MSDDKDDQPIGIFWDSLEIARHRAPSPQEELHDSVGPNDLVIGTSRRRILVVIKPDGQLVFGPDYRPDEASQVFFRALAQRRYEDEDRRLLNNHMEGVLSRLGAVDMRLEDLRRRSANGDPDAIRDAGSVHAQLESIMHQAIELGRALAKRPDVPQPAIPKKIPMRVQQNPQSDYKGQAGIVSLPEDNKSDGEA